LADADAGAAHFTLEHYNPSDDARFATLPLASLSAC
jgi:hypothetical protein